MRLRVLAVCSASSSGQTEYVKAKAYMYAYVANAIDSVESEME